MKLLSSLIILSMFLQGSALADEQSPVVYSRTILKVVPASSSAADAKEQTKKKTDDAKKATTSVTGTRTTKEYTVDVRPLQFLAQRDFIAHQPFSDKGGMLALITPAQVTELKSSNLLGNVDVLFVAPDGLITKIMPNLSLPALEEPISSETPVRAFVFLKGQTAKTDDVQPGDHIDNPLFRPHPVVLEGSTPPQPQIQLQPSVTEAPQKLPQMPVQ
jgi:uncharacterized membrane protein (UPF0127 family)